jgi:6-pyruvoyltetrahydropterin/6-carboxytetrahydropterin synthase
MFKSTKTYHHTAGLSCCFRQHRTDSHCRFLHGYPLAFKFTFGCEELDVRNWCVDFGSLKSLKGWLEGMYDHTCLVAADDPHIEWFRKGQELGLLDLRVVDSTGCEATARLVFECTEIWLKDNGYSPRVWLCSVEVSEHGGNSAIYEPYPPPFRVSSKTLEDPGLLGIHERQRIQNK